MHVQVPSSATNFGFKNLCETFMVEVYKAENRPLNVPLIAPFTIASSRLEKVENVGIRIELKNGCVGWGEAPILPFVTAEDQPTAMAKAKEACEMLKGCSFITLGAVLGQILVSSSGYRHGSTVGRKLLERDATAPGTRRIKVRAGVEMALIDAAAKSIGVPLWRLFGGASNTITTDITIPIVSPAEAAALASKYRGQGFGTLKLKVGKNLKADIEVLQAIRAAHPDCSFILDANEGYRPEEAIEVLEKLHGTELTPVLFEQPVHRDDWEGLGRVSRFAKSKYGVSVAADESSRNLADVKKIVQGELADVVNIKLAKVGVLGALEIIDLARASGLDLMIGGMVETRLAMGFAGHLAAGLGCFKFIDLDTPLLLSEDPVLEGYEGLGAVYKFANAAGHGSYLHWENVACFDEKGQSLWFKHPRWPPACHSQFAPSPSLSCIVTVKIGTWLSHLQCGVVPRFPVSSSDSIVPDFGPEQSLTLLAYDV
ncbi:hypothetical protein GQ457_11G031400 [Hibiscus cannabinus]